MQLDFYLFHARSSRALRLLAMAVLVLLPSAAHAGRVGGITIDVDGKRYLSTRTYDSGSPPPAAVWRYLASTELQPSAGVTIAVEPADPLHAALRGRIVIDVRYGGKAEVAELHLVRRSPDAGWTVVPEDVERIAAAIGLRDIPVVPSNAATATPDGSSGIRAGDAFPWIWVAVGGMVVAALVLAVIRRRNRNADRVEPGTARDAGA